MSDGDLMEGVASEAASIAGHLRLGNIIYLYDDNRISIDGPTTLAFTEDVGKRFDAYGWHVQSVDDGNDLAAIEQAITAALSVSDRPHLIRVRTHIGYGSPHKQDTADSHGSPLGESEVALTKKQYGWDPDRPFHVPDEALAFFRKAVAMGSSIEHTWRRLYEGYRQSYPKEADLLERIFAGQLGQEWKNHLPPCHAGLPAHRAPGATGRRRGRDSSNARNCSSRMVSPRICFARRRKDPAWI